MRRKWCLFAMALAMLALCTCSNENAIKPQENVLTECPYIEPILEFGKVTAEDVRDKEERILYQDRWDENTLITTPDRDKFPWTAYVFKEKEKTLDYCAMILEDSQLSAVSYYLDNRYGEALPKGDDVKMYADKEHGYNIMLVTEIKYDGAFALAYFPAADSDRIVVELIGE